MASHSRQSAQNHVHQQFLESNGHAVTVLARSGSPGTQHTLMYVGTAANVHSLMVIEAAMELDSACEAWTRSSLGLCSESDILEYH